MTDDYTGWPRVSVASRLLGYHVNIERLIRDGELRVVKPDKIRFVEPASLEAALARRAGVSNLAEAHDKIARLHSQIDQLNATIRDLDSSRETTAEDALSILSLEECLDILGRIETEGMSWDERGHIYHARQSVQQQLDHRDRRVFAGKRPKGVPEQAKHRQITTGIGAVDIWYWRTRGGRWNASYGGPRGPWPGSRNTQETMREAIKTAGFQARQTYGKPNRKTSTRLRFSVLEQAGFACTYCGRRAPDVELHVDHIVPIAEGGSNEPDNLTAACQDCNLGKNSRPLVE